MCTAVGSGGGRVTDFFWVALSNMIVVGRLIRKA
jgi:hypothetical protein